MTTQHTALQELALRAKSLRQQVSDSRNSQTSKGRRKGTASPSPRDNQLHDNLLTLLELVDSLEEAIASPPPESPVSSSRDSDAATAAAALPPTGFTAEQMLAALDQGVAGWQAKISLAYASGASQELADHLRLAERLSESFHQRETRLEAQRQQLEASLTEVLQREARTARQRATIAHSLRARKAELRLEMEQLLQHRTAQLRQDLQLKWEQSPAIDTDELESLRRELQSRRSAEENLRNEADSLRGELAGTRERLQELSSDNADQSPTQHLLITDLEEQLAEANTQLTRLHEQLESQSDTPLLIEAQAESITELKTQLEQSKQQLEDLQQQNSDLAATLAKHQVISSGNSPHVSFQQESLSWEERKRLMMAQLEGESAEDEALSDDQVERRLEIEQVITTTQQEIEKRDREIAELQAIVEQQSDTRHGVAIGAAAFAQAFDNDEMIQQERKKLKEIQREWEEKLRQAEIDVSLERARLARERLQLETELANIKREESLADKEPEKAKKRKWLEHLGLRDEGH